MTRDYADVQDFELNDKDTLQGEKGFSTTFVGRQAPPGENGPKRPLIRRRDYFVRRKGYLVHWIEFLPVEQSAAVEAAFKKARAGIVWN